MQTVDRTFRVRGKPVHVQELTDLAAVRADAAPRSARSPLAAFAPDAALPQVRELEDAGWRFVPREQAADGARVFLKPGGRVALGTDRLAVRVAEALPPEAARDLLEREGLRVVEHLKFAPNLFVAAVPPGADALEVARRLDALGDVEFAEPQLIESIPGR
jgi:hypothetical protein